MEETYCREKLTADEIYRRRNSKETTDIIDKIKTELYDLLANPDESRSKLMSKILNYLKSFWTQIFAYRNDGEYSIAPSIYNLYRNLQTGRSLLQRLLLQVAFFSSHDNMQIVIVKFVDSFLDGCQQAPV